MQNEYGYYSQGYVYGRSQVNHDDGQKRAPSGQSSVETLADMPKQEERKFNLRLTGFEAKEGETEQELVQQINT